VEILTNLFARKFGDICTIGLGDSENDFPMLEKVDRAYLVMKPNGKYASQKYENAKGIGPEGWNTTVLKEVE
jgi:mannosyl-3-phosphoglycerate phosphatase